MSRWIDHLVDFAHQNLSEDRLFEELWSRGVTDDQISLFRIGYLDRKLPELEKAGDFLKWCHGGQKLDDCYVFPLTNALGQVKGLQFRHVERSVKGYMDYFLAKDEPVLFGLGQAMPHIWTSQVVCLVEGNFDLFPIQRVLPNTIATLTSDVSSRFLRFLRRNVREVWFGYDMDAVGRKGAFSFIKDHGRSFDRVKVGQFPRVQFADGKRAKDPGELWEASGEERFGVYVKTAFGL